MLLMVALYCLIAGSEWWYGKVGRPIIKRHIIIGNVKFSGAPLSSIFACRHVNILLGVTVMLAKHLSGLLSVISRIVVSNVCFRGKTSGNYPQVKNWTSDSKLVLLYFASTFDCYLEEIFLELGR